MNVIDEDTYVIYKHLVRHERREVEDLLRRLAGREGEEARLLRARINIKRKVIADMQEEIEAYEARREKGTPNPS